VAVRFVHVLSALAAVPALALLGLGALSVRRWVLRRAVGSFDCSLRRRPQARSRGPGRGWVLGVARYAGDRVDWYRAFSFSPRPLPVVSRRGLVVRDRRKPGGPEAFALLAGAVIVECIQDGRRLDLAMSQEALTGFLAWLEAAPPGAHLDGA